MNETDEYPNIEYVAKSGKTNILKYFDRIHDKLFSFNNIMIVGYFALSKIETEINIEYILIPIGNLIYLIFIEYKMMELSRTESNLKEIPIDKLNKKLYSRYKSVTLMSLFAIVTTLVVTIIFLIYLIF